MEHIWLFMILFFMVCWTWSEIYNNATKDDKMIRKCDWKTPVVAIGKNVFVATTPWNCQKNNNTDRKESVALAAHSFRSSTWKKNNKKNQNTDRSERLPHPKLAKRSNKLPVCIHGNILTVTWLDFCCFFSTLQEKGHPSSCWNKEPVCRGSIRRSSEAFLWLHSQRRAAVNIRWECAVLLQLCSNHY